MIIIIIMMMITMMMIIIHFRRIADSAKMQNTGDQPEKNAREGVVVEDDGVREGHPMRGDLGGAGGRARRGRAGPGRAGPLLAGGGRWPGAG